MANADEETLRAFDAVWALHGARAAGRRRGRPGADGDRAFAAFFSLLPPQALAGGEGFDLGCGFGRIARRLAPHVARLHCIDPSAAALAAARRAMAHLANVDFHQAGVDSLPFPDGSQDFGYSLGVLHHLPDPEAGLRSCVLKLKPGAPFLLYLYYRLDDRPAWFRALWKASDRLRRGISALPFPARRRASDAIALLAYWPLSRAARLAEQAGLDVGGFPLADYRHSSLATLRADALDRFGTPLEHRFTRGEIGAMMERCGLDRVRFRDGPPYWVAVGWRR
ncbi:MAG: methyltransferase domain-containing protein [Alphaproteobacteria bacterium]|nr:methyltransferase domain-containing protein [Alphaproteobacteria bacterium]MBV9371819.1 methyltransferase domain-containing protein [Alphaproteobacteria bacterium]MBV9900386.1 methyltransferase domain-containing protein [Alphaproteobacteria bacterium]